MVAAWISALTGVGPSIALANQEWRPENWALLAAAPIKNRIDRKNTISVLIYKP
jgi:hypothetical protein